MAKKKDKNIEKPVEGEEIKVVEAEEPKAEEAKVDEPAAEEVKAEDTPAVEEKAEEPAAEAPAEEKAEEALLPNEVITTPDENLVIEPTEAVPEVPAPAPSEPELIGTIPGEDKVVEILPEPVHVEKEDTHGKSDTEVNPRVDPKMVKGGGKVKFKAFVKKYKWILVAAFLAIAIVLSITIPVAVDHAPKVFISKASDFDNQKLLKGKKTRYVLKKNIVYDGDLILNNDLDIDLNGKTLTVTGTLKRDFGASSKAVTVGTVKKKSFTSGGNINANAVDFKGASVTLNFLSEVTATGDFAVKTVNFYNFFDASSGTLTFTNSGANIFSEVRGRLDLVNSVLNTADNSRTVEIAADKLSTLEIRGTVQKSVTGGFDVSFLGNAVCPIATDALTYYVQDATAKVESILTSGVINVVMQLDKPKELSIVQDGDKFICTVSQVFSAGFYAFTFDGVAKKPEYIGQNQWDITDYLTEPKTYTIGVTAVGEEGKTWKESLKIDSETLIVSYLNKIALANPVPTIEVDDGKYYLKLPTVAFASKYKGTINGTYFEFASVGGHEVAVQSFDITSYLTALGVYTISVAATNESEAFIDSKAVMTSYVRTETLDAVTGVDGHRGGADGSVTLEWNAVEHAKTYFVEFKAQIVDEETGEITEWSLRIATSKTELVLDGDEIPAGATFTVYAGTIGFYVERTDESGKPVTSDPIEIPPAVSKR